MAAIYRDLTSIRTRPLRLAYNLHAAHNRCGAPAWTQSCATMTIRQRKGKTMKRKLTTASAAWLLAGAAAASPTIEHEVGRAAYDNALQAYMCVNYEKALHLFLENAQKGHALSQYMVGVMLSDGQGQEEDDRQAFEWIRRAAQQEVADAQFALAGMYQKGEGVERDDAQALYWYELALRGGYRLAKDGIDSVVAILAPERVAEVRRLVAEQLAQRAR